MFVCLLGKQAGEMFVCLVSKHANNHKKKVMLCFRETLGGEESPCPEGYGNVQVFTSRAII